MRRGKKKQKIESTYPLVGVTHRRRPFRPSQLLTDDENVDDDQIISTLAPSIHPSPVSSTLGEMWEYLLEESTWYPYWPRSTGCCRPFFFISFQLTWIFSLHLVWPSVRQNMCVHIMLSQWNTSRSYLVMVHGEIVRIHENKIPPTHSTRTIQLIVWFAFTCKCQLLFTGNYFCHRRVVRRVCKLCTYRPHGSGADRENTFAAVVALHHGNGSTMRYWPHPFMNHMIEHIY